MGEGDNDKQKKKLKMPPLSPSKWGKNSKRAQQKEAEAKEKQAQSRKDVEHTEQTWEWSQIVEHYTTNLERGLTLQQVLANREKYGLNQLTPPKKRNELLIFLE